MGSMNPILAELDGLSPSAKQALLQAHQGASNPMQGTQAPNPAMAALRSPAAPAGPEPPAPTIPPIGGGPSVPAIGASHPNVIAPKGTLTGDQAERSRLMSTGSGESQIYNKVTNSGFGQAHSMVGKILGGLGQGAAMIGDAAASSVLPQLTRAIPGTESHHQALLHSANTAVANDEANAGKEAQTAQSQADLPLIQAQTREANATADAKENPQPSPKEEAWEIAKDYTGPNGEPVEVEKNSGQMRIAGQTGPAFKRVQAAEKTGNDFEQFYKDYIKDNNIPDSAHNRMMARKEWATASQAPERPEKAPQVPVIGPDGRLVVLHPGDSMPKGSMSPTQLGSQNASEVKETKAEARASENLDGELNLMKQFAAHPSPTNDAAMLMHYIGATKPESMGKIRLNERELTLFGGTRSSLGDAQALLEKVTNGQSLTPQQRADMVNTMSMIAQAAKRGPQDGGAPQGSGLGVSLKDAMALPQNKGKTADEVRKDIESHGHKAVE